MKLIFDYLLAFIGLFLLSPLLILISIFIKFTSRGPVFYTQQRVGRFGKLFTILKFRSMTADHADSNTITVSGDMRITKFGRFLRKYKLDELPELLNIIKGEMSFVGPRPALFNQDDLIMLRAEKGIDALLPGITGWAQVNGRDELSIYNKVALDLEYLNQQSFYFDIKILWLTLVKVIMRENILH